MRLLLGLLLVACASRPEPRPDVDFVTTRDDTADLLRALPAGASRCVGARVGAVPEERRVALGRVSGGSRLAWARGAPVALIAEAYQSGTEDRASARVLLRGADASEVMHYLEHRAPIRVIRFSGRACPGPRCWSYRMSRVDARTVSVHRGPWASRRSGVEHLCAELAERHPDAYEVTARHLGSSYAMLGAVGEDPETVASHTTQRIEPRTGGVRLHEVIDGVHFGHTTHALAHSEAQQAFASKVRTEVEVDAVRTTMDILWEDLELAAYDERVMNEALAHEARAEVPMPVERVNIASRAELEAQIERRLERFEQSGAREELVAVRALLERGVDVHSDDDDLALRLMRLLLEPFRDSDAAQALAERALAGAPVDRSEWQLLRRRALAQQGPTELAAALREDGVVRRTRAAAAAQMLTRVPEPGDYEWAEAAFVAAEQMRGQRTMPVRGGALPLASLLETVVLLIEDVEGLTPTLQVYAMVETPVALEEGGSDPARSRAFTWREGSRSLRIGGGAMDDGDHLRGLGLEMVRDLVDGRLSMRVALVPFDEGLDAATGSLTVEGVVRDDRLVVERASASFDFEAVGHFLGEPLEGLELRLFPTPDINVSLPSTQLAAEAMERARAEETLECSRRGAELRCRASPDLLVSRRAFARIVLPFLGADRR